MKTIGEGGATRGGPPKKGRKSVNFKIPPKGAQSSKAMGRSQFNQTKINHRDNPDTLKETPKRHPKDTQDKHYMLHNYTPRDNLATS